MTGAILGRDSISCLVGMGIGNCIHPGEEDSSCLGPWKPHLGVSSEKGVFIYLVVVRPGFMMGRHLPSIVHHSSSFPFTLFQLPAFPWIHHQFAQDPTDVPPTWCLAIPYWLHFHGKQCSLFQILGPASDQVCLWNASGAVFFWTPSQEPKVQAWMCQAAGLQREGEWLNHAQSQPPAPALCCTSLPCSVYSALIVQ